MPFQRNLYPPDWEDITLTAKIAANWTCQRCGVQRGDKQVNRHGKLSSVVLTTAHLDHDPWNKNARLQVLCWPCHARYDASQRRRQKRMMQIARGQMVLPGLAGWYEPPVVRKPRKEEARPVVARRGTRRVRRRSPVRKEVKA